MILIWLDSKLKQKVFCWYQYFLQKLHVLKKKGQIKSCVF